MKRKVLVVAPDRKTRGGITSVINSHEKSDFWEKWNCQWIGTYVDRDVFLKIMFFIKGLMYFLVKLPNTSIVHIHFSEPTSAARKNIFLYISKLFNKPVVVHFHSFSADTTVSGKRKDLYKKIFNKADAIIVLSNYWKKQVEQIVVKPEKIKVVYNPCPEIKQKFNVEKQKSILFAGTLNERKGYSDLIRAFSKIAVRFPDWKIIFAGNGEIELAKKLSNSLEISNNVVFKGWISGLEKEALFCSSSIFCLPSYAEGFPMAVLDAWAFGLPVITTPVGGLPDVLLHGENSLVFQPGDIDGLAENLKILINDNSLRIKLAEASLQLSSNTFNIKTISSQIDNLYSSIL
jgi:glycosyltransferase involved in cell wall biosynthesis